jgi:hypothetical protein
MKKIKCIYIKMKVNKQLSSIDYDLSKQVSYKINIMEEVR